jgi:hypothetical protein
LAPKELIAERKKKERPFVPNPDWLGLTVD